MRPGIKGGARAGAAVARNGNDARADGRRHEYCHPDPDISCGGSMPEAQLKGIKR